MRGFIATLILLLTASSSIAQNPATIGEDQARTAAAQFGRALARSNVGMLAPLLPERGKVRMRLRCLGPEDGSFSASQVQALLQDFLKEGSVTGFEVMRLEGDLVRYALVHTRAKVVDRFGTPTNLDLHLSLQVEGTRWVLREIRESSP